MNYKSVFKRYEQKYLVTPSQLSAVLAAVSPYMSIDGYGRSTILNIYYDTPSYLLIRRSIDHPVFKEKLRLRSYSTSSGQAFVELKRKCDHVVYKRRLATTEREATLWLAGERPAPENTQISREIDYFLSIYPGLAPRLFLSYEREAYYMRDGTDLRLTVDYNVTAREYDLTFSAGIHGTPLLPEGVTLMEIKASGGIPLWLAHALSRAGIYKTTFSKYGTAYKTIIYPRISAGKEINKETEKPIYVH